MKLILFVLFCIKLIMVQQDKTFYNVMSVPENSEK